MKKKLTKKELDEIKMKAFAEELKAGYVSQSDKIILGMATHHPKFMDLFLMIMFGENRERVGELSFDSNTAKQLIIKLQTFVNEIEGGTK